MTALPRRRRRRASSEAGFTLIELMISLVMFSFAIAGVLAVAVSMTNGFREQRQAVTAESSARAGMEFLAESLRGISPGVQSGEIYHGGGCGQGALELTNNATGPDTLTAVFAYGAVVTSTRTSLTDGDLQVTVADASELAVGDTLLITDFATGHLVEISSILANPPLGDDVVLDAVTRCIGAPLPVAGYPAGSMVIRALHARFSI